jgi:hypothetical protein
MDEKNNVPLKIVFDDGKDFRAEVEKLKALLQEVDELIDSVNAKLAIIKVE